MESRSSEFAMYAWFFLFECGKEKEENVEDMEPIQSWGGQGLQFGQV